MTSTSSLLEPVSIMTNVLKAHLIKSAIATKRLADDERAAVILDECSGRVANCFNRGGKLLICGNGGSAADACHIAAEFVGRFKLERQPLPALALAGDPAIMTAVGNDYGYAEVFARQVQAFGNRADLLWAISTSGASVNVLHAMHAARKIGMPVIGFSSYQCRDSDFPKLTDTLFDPPVRDTALIQQLHMIAAHAICDAVEQELTD